VTAANVQDIELLLPLVEQIDHRRIGVLYADRGYSSQRRWAELDRLGVSHRIPGRRQPNGSGLGRYRWVVERTFAWLHTRRRLLVRTDRRHEIHQAFIDLACALICLHRLEASL
jgi:transposase